MKNLKQGCRRGPLFVTRKASYFTGAYPGLFINSMILKNTGLHPYAHTRLSP
jgi:hypothetical protein